MQLSSKKAQLNQRLALFFTSIIGACYTVLLFCVQLPNLFIYSIAGIVGILLCYSSYRFFTQKYRERTALLSTPFPEAWKTVLHQYVTFYQGLNQEEKRRFETEIQIFLHEKRITGVQTTVDTTTLVLVAASAVIPVFGFPEWEYENLNEILIYPNAFNKDFQIEGENRTVLGMVGTGLMHGVMILSQPALLAGFKINNDKKNVGIHEFVHLLDASDGAYDGIPKRFLAHQYIEPWIEVMHKEIARIKAEESSLDAYGGSNTTEFFAVAAEYFFEHPKSLEKDHPELYMLLSKVFNQDIKNRLRLALKAAFHYKRSPIGRNTPCPCNSGKKYKNCCIKNSIRYSN